MPLIACEFYGCVSASDLVSWNESDSCISNTPLRLALDLIGVTCDPCELYHFFFEDTQVGSGDVLLFRSKTDPNGVFVIDLYREVTDQLDLLAFGMRCSEQNAGELKMHLRRFFDSAECQILFEEASINLRLRELINHDLYPRIAKDSDYTQQLIED